MMAPAIHKSDKEHLCELVEAMYSVVQRRMDLKTWPLNPGNTKTA